MKKALLFTFSIILSGFLFAQNCTELFISEYVEGSGNNKALEIYNPTDAAIDLSAYQLVRYSNGGTTPNAVALGGTIMPKDVYVVVLEKLDPNGTGQEIMVDPALQAKADTFLCPTYDVNKAMYFNGNDAMTLETLGGGEILDIVARVGTPDPDNGWCAFTDTTITWTNGGLPEDYTIVNYAVGPLFWLSWTRDHTLIRKSDIQAGVSVNPAVFMVHMEWDSLAQNTFDNLGTHECDCNSLSVSELVEGVDISFYPNPVTKNVLNINAQEKFNSITVFNTTGQTVLTENYQGVFNSAISTTQLQTGVYFVKVGFENQSSFVKKIIKQ